MAITMCPTSRHYYGFNWACDIGAHWVEGDGTSYPCGTVFVFDSKEERDEWVGSEPRDGRRSHRSTMASAEAVSIIRRCVRECSPYPSKVGSYDVDRLIALYVGDDEE